MEAIRDLLDALEAADNDGAPVTDTDIRERLYEVIEKGFVQQENGYQPPTDLLLDCENDPERWNGAVVNALAMFLRQGKEQAVALKLDTLEKRREAFLGCEVQSSSGATDVDDFFG